MGLLYWYVFFIEECIILENGSVVCDNKCGYVLEDFVYVWVDFVVEVFLVEGEYVEFGKVYVDIVEVVGGEGDLELGVRLIKLGDEGYLWGIFERVMEGF